MSHLREQVALLLTGAIQNTEDMEGLWTAFTDTTLPPTGLSQDGWHGAEHYPVHPDSFPVWEDVALVDNEVLCELLGRLKAGTRTRVPSDNSKFVTALGRMLYDYYLDKKKPELSLTERCGACKGFMPWQSGEKKYRHTCDECSAPLHNAGLCTRIVHPLPVLCIHYAYCAFITRTDTLLRVMAYHYAYWPAITRTGMTVRVMRIVLACY